MSLAGAAGALVKATLKGRCSPKWAEKLGQSFIAGLGCSFGALKTQSTPSSDQNKKLDLVNKRAF